MKLGIFVNKQHKNYIPYISFLCSQIPNHDNVIIESYSTDSKISSYSYYDVNIFLNRYALLDIEKILKFNFTESSVIKNNFFCSIAIILNKDIVAKSEEKLIDHLTSLKYSSDLIHNISYMPSVGAVGCSQEKALFLCYNDLDDNFISFLKEYHYKEKRISYNDIIKTINPKKQLIKYKNTDLVLLDKNNKIIWDQIKNKWVKFNSKKEIF
jgi:hypothetical protein